MIFVDSIRSWLRDQLGITKLEQDNAYLQSLVHRHGQFVSEQIKSLKDYTRVDADMGIRGQHTIILTGVYRKQAYVRFYDLKDEEFKFFVEKCRDLNRHALLRNIDHPPTFHGIFDLIESDKK